MENDSALVFQTIVGSAIIGAAIVLLLRLIRLLGVGFRWGIVELGAAFRAIKSWRIRAERHVENVEQTPRVPDQTILRKALKPKVSAEKAQPYKRHRLELNVLKGHSDAITGIAFTSNGRGLATACADRIVRVFKIDDASSKSFQFLRLNVPSGSTPVGVIFGEGASKVVVATQDITGAGLLMYGASDGKAAAIAREQGKLPPPEIRWENHQIHDKNSVVNIVSAPAEYGSGDGSVMALTCSEGTDIKLWHVNDGKCIGTVDTNQLKNTMATLSPDGRFVAAAAFTADVKVWEVIYAKDGQIRELVKVMLLKGHKSAVTWLCFMWDSQRIITTSKDGTMRIWNLNVRYQMDEDPKCLKVFPILLNYDRIAVSPNNKIIAATHGSTLSWLNPENGEVIDTATNAHDGEITSLVWAPQPLMTGNGKNPVLATASVDKKLKLWLTP